MIIQSDHYFLSKTNPVANVDQRDLEKLCMKLVGRSDVRAAGQRAQTMFRRATDRSFPAEQFARLEQTVANYCLKCTMVAASTDSNCPRVLRVYTEQAEWFGHRISGSKWGGDNPDNAYRLIGIGSGGHYELHGQRQKEPSTYVTYQLVGNSCTSVTLGSLEQLDLDINADGSYLITLDATPTNGRRNHLTVPPGTLFLFIRDSLGNWATQAPDALRVYRKNPPTRAPLTEDEIAALAIQFILSDVFYHLYAARLYFNAPQQMTPPEGSGTVGGLLTQQGSLGYFTLADDEAIIITASEGGATYRSVVLHDLWLLSLPNRDRQISQNNAQMQADADGRFTHVISIADPGIYNWLDPTGFHDVLVYYRWQGFPDPTSSAPSIEARKVKMSQMVQALPKGVVRVTPVERDAQLRHRRESFDRRYADS